MVTKNQRILIGSAILIWLIILTISAFALSFPLTIGGHVEGYSLDGQTVTVTNLRTGLSDTKTLMYGDYLVNALDFGGYDYLDKFLVEVNFCKDNSECVQTLEYTNQGSLTANFDVRSIQAVPLECAAWTTEDCQNVFGLEPISDCDPCQECEEYPVQAVILAIVALVAGIGGGAKFYKKLDGTIAIQLKHKGITGYHDPNILHKDKRYAHRRYKDNPSGCLADHKKINEEGSL